MANSTAELHPFKTGPPDIMKLLIATPSPFARKARIALHEKALAFEEIVDVPWSPDTAAPASNPLGKIPVLFLDDGRTVYDSSVIVECIEMLVPEPPLIPQDPLARLLVRQIEALADGICDAVVLIVVERNRKEAQRSRDWIARQWRKVEAGTAELSRLLDGRAHFVGDAFSLADIAAGSALRYLDLRLPDFDWRGPHPDLVAFSDRMESRESFQRSVPRAQTIAPIE